MKGRCNSFFLFFSLFCVLTNSKKTSWHSLESVASVLKRFIFKEIFFCLLDVRQIPSNSKYFTYMKIFLNHHVQRTLNLWLHPFSIGAELSLNRCDLENNDCVTAVVMNKFQNKRSLFWSEELSRRGAAPEGQFRRQKQ